MSFNKIKCDNAANDLEYVSLFKDNAKFFKSYTNKSIQIRMIFDVFLSKSDPA